MAFIFGSAFWRICRVPVVLGLSFAVSFAVILIGVFLADDAFFGIRPEFAIILTLFLPMGVVIWSSWLPVAIGLKRTLFVLLIVTMAVMVAAFYEPSAAWLGLTNEWLTALTWIGLTAVFLLALALSRMASPDLAIDGPPDEVSLFEARVLSHLADQRAAAIAHHLVREAERMRRLSFLTLTGVAAIMSVAVFVVLFAGLITSIDLTGTDPLSKARVYADETRMSYLRTLDETRLAEREIAALQAEIDSGLPSPGQTRSLRDSRSVADELADVKDRLLRLTEDMPIMKERSDNAQALLDRVKTRDVEGTKTADDNQATNALIASAVTRFGVIFVLMFLAQALINLYRYALRLSAFYRSRAVMIVLTEGDMDAMERASKTLSADHVSLGREPRSPIEDAKRLAEIARDLKP